MKRKWFLARFESNSRSGSHFGSRKREERGVAGVKGDGKKAG